MLDRSAMHCILRWTTLNNINSGMHTSIQDVIVVQKTCKYITARSSY